MPMKKSMVLNSVYESQTPELCGMLPSNLILIGLSPTNRDCVALRNIISHRRLERIELSNFNFDSFKMIVPGLRLNMPNHLTLIQADIREEGIALLADKISEVPVTTLYLQACGITEEGANILSCGLCGSGLRKLSLSHNSIGDAGLRHIASKLTRTCIECLILNNCGIGDERVIILSKTLHKTRINQLYLLENPISTRGLKALTEAIMKCPYFRGLWIGNTRNPSIATEGIKELLITLKNHPTFSNLVINDKDYNELSGTIEIVNEERKKLSYRKIEVSSIHRRRLDY